LHFGVPIIPSAERKIKPAATPDRPYRKLQIFKLNKSENQNTIMGLSDRDKNIRRWYGLLVIPALVPAFFIYRRVLDIGFFADDFVLLNWLATKSHFNFFKAFLSLVNDTRSRPVSSLTWILKDLLGIAFNRYSHLDSIFFHCLSASLLGVWIRGLTKNTGAAVMAGLIFLYYPIQPEAVFWIAAWNDPICLAFMLLALIFYAKDMESASRRYPALIFFFGMLALFSKETAVAMFGTAACMELAALLETRPDLARPWKPDTRRQLERLARRVTCLLTILATYIAVRVYLTGSLLPEAISREMGKGSRVLRLEIALHHLLLPVWNPGLVRDLPGWVFVVIPLLALLLAFYKAPRFRFLAVALTIMAFSLAPSLASQWEPGDYIGGRFLYIPSAGLCMALGLLFLDSRKPGNSGKTMGMAMAIIYLLTCMVQLNRNVHPFEEGRALVSEAIVTAASACKTSSCRPCVYLMDFPRNRNGVMLFSRDIAIAAALNLALTGKMQFKLGSGPGSGQPLISLKKDFPLPPITAYHTGRASPGEDVTLYPTEADLRAGRCALFKWENKTDQLNDITGPLLERMNLRNGMLENLTAPLPAVDFIKDGKLLQLTPGSDIHPDDMNDEFVATGNDPFLLSGRLSINPLQVDTALIRMSFRPIASGPAKITGQLFWQPANASTFSEAESLIFPVNGDGAVHTYKLELGSNPRFLLQNEIVRLRFDPVDARGRLRLEAFTITPASRRAQ
jgi:hypothetical protein